MSLQINILPNNEVPEQTDERMIPEKSDTSTFWEHIYRYRFAARFVRGKNVLDIACGMGYGTAALNRAGAASVIGIDVSEEVCATARMTYGVDARVGNAENMPLTDKCVDLIVSFETIEHLTKPESFLAECGRVLTKGGTLLISTPNQRVYSSLGKKCSFHLVEFNQDEFELIIGRYFSKCQFYGQLPVSAGWWSSESFAAEKTPWLQLKGAWRVREMLRNVSCAHLKPDVTEKFKRSAVETILSGDNFLSHFVNPYSVRKCSVNRRGESTYVIAVAQNV